MIHNFDSKLAESQDPNNEAWWEQAYRKAFPNFIGFMPVIGDSDLQRQGVDRIVALKAGPTLYFDEKLRTGNYTDILIEYEANDRTHAAGWIEKDLKIHFIAYGLRTTGRVYFLPWPLLRRAWRIHKTQWLADAKARRNGLELIPGKNANYTTWNVAVPIPVLTQAIALAATSGVITVQIDSI